MADEVYDQVLSQLGLEDGDTTEPGKQETETEDHRQMLIGLAQSGLLHKLGIKRSEAQLQNLSSKQVEALWTEYENRYSASVSDDLIRNMLYAYSRFWQWLVPTVDANELTEELNENFVVTAELKNQLGRIGRVLQTPLLAIANVAVITGKNVHDAAVPEATSE